MDPKLALSGSGRSDVEIGKSAVGKSHWFLLPVILITTSLGYIDRSNVAYAAVTLKKVLHMTNSQYGLASGLLYVSYCTFQVPVQMITARVGAPVTLSVMVVSWGIVAASTAAVKTVNQFYALRFLLGLCEAGLFPACFKHLSLFFSEGELSLAYAIMLTALSCSQVVGGPLAGGLQYITAGGLYGFQWLFIIEGIITVTWGCCIWFLLPKGPETARLLDEEEKEWIIRRRTTGLERAMRDHPEKAKLIHILTNYKMLWYAGMGFIIQAVLAGCIFFVPLIIDSMFTGQFNGRTTTVKIKTLDQLRWQICKVSLVAAILYTCTALSGIAIGWSSKRFRERNLHVFGGLVVAGICLMCVPVTIDNKGAVSAFAVMTVGAAGAFGIVGPTCSWVVTLVHGQAREVAFALFNSIGGVGAFAGPTIIGKLSNNGNWRSSLYFMGGLCLLSAFMALLFRPSNILVAGDKDAAESEEDSAEMKSVPVVSPDLKL